MIALALKALGLMRVSEHEAVASLLDDEAFTAWNKAKTERDEFEAKFKRAATNLAAQADEIASLKSKVEVLEDVLAETGAAEMTALAQLERANVDAQKWRDYLKRSRDRKAGKK